jgi:hypothetical protein
MATKILLEHVGVEGIRAIDTYLAHGGYRSVGKALKEMSSDQLVEEVKTAGLRGSRRSRVSHRNEVVIPRQKIRKSEVPGLQCRRIGARYV